MSYEIVARRAGDVAEVYADPSLANKLLGWRAELGIDAMCRDAWRWQSMNPEGYVTGAAAPGERFHASPEAVLPETYVGGTPPTPANQQQQRCKPRARKHPPGSAPPNHAKDP